MPSPRILTALEHEPIAITQDGSEGSLSPAEVVHLAKIGEQRPGFCEIGVRQVKLAQYCGVVSMGDRVLEVLPKTQMAAEPAEDCRGVVLRLLALAARFPKFQHQSVGQHLRRAPLLEAFIATFFDTVTSIARGGLLRQYQEQSDDLRLIRGRIDLARQIGRLSNRPDVAACVFDELTADNVWNRVLKAGVRITRAWIRSAELQRRWFELMGLFDEIDDTRLLASELAALSFNRQADRYRTAVAWARALLNLLSPALRGGQHEAPALLFDMNKLFEAAIATRLRQLIQSLPGHAVDSQDTSTALATMVTPEQVVAAFSLRPDLVIRQGAKVLAIADTKWKRVAQDNLARLLPSEADIYQMHAYASAFRCHELALIYPWRADLRPATVGEFHLPTVEGRSPVVRVVCVDVHDDTLPARFGDWPGLPNPALATPRMAA